MNTTLTITNENGVFTFPVSLELYECLIGSADVGSSFQVCLRTETEDMRLVCVPLGATSED